MTYYVAILDGGKDVWGVRFPDFSGCYGGGPTPDAAIADATSALREFAALTIADGDPIPRARTLEELGPDERPGRGEYLVMIPLILDKGRLVEASISLDAGLLETIDEEAKRRGLTRSAFLASAAIDKIETAGLLSGRNEQQGIAGDHSNLQVPVGGGFAEPAAADLKPRGKGKTRRRAD
jgi:predicted RNase H-like HicB family nuclease